MAMFPIRASGPMPHPAVRCAGLFTGARGGFALHAGVRDGLVGTVSCSARRAPREHGIAPSCCAATPARKA
jgi:hypothetical protein